MATAGERGSIPGHLKLILTILNIEPDHWLGGVSNFKGPLDGWLSQLSHWTNGVSAMTKTTKPLKNGQR